MLSKTLSMSCWETVSTGLGHFSYVDPETGETVETYGIIADTVIGKLILGENLKIYSESGKFEMGDDGLKVTAIDGEDNSDLFVVQKQKTDDQGRPYVEKYIYVDSNGDVKITGNSITIGAKPLTEYIEDEVDEVVGDQIEDARKVATNYLAVDNTGIMVANMEGGEQTPSSILSGNNVFINDTSINIRDGQATLASFGKDGIQIGLNNETRTEQDYHSWKMIDKDDDVYALVSDLRGKDGKATLTETVKLNEATNWAETNFDIDSIIDVTVNGNAPDSYQKRLSNLIDIEPEPTNEDVIVVTYTSQSPELKAYTFGKRYPNSNIGGYSFAEGINCTSSGYGSHAEGFSNIASGESSHAEGLLTRASGSGSHAQNYHTTASSMYQTAIGKYNIDDANNKYAFIIGNGGFDQEHSKWRYSNAFTVDWDGNIEFSGNMYCAGGNYLPSNTNIDDLTKKHSGWWAYSRSDTLGTFPITDTYGIIGHIQGTSDNVAMQFLRSNSQGTTNPILYTRYKMGGTWGAWQRYVNTITTNLTITRTDNSYCNVTDINYLQARKKGGYLSLRGNLHLTTSMPTGTENIQIATISNWQGVSGFLCVPAQTGNSTLLVSISSSGVVTISNYSGVATNANWFRFTFTTPCEDGYE